MNRTIDFVRPWLLAAAAYNLAWGAAALFAARPMLELLGIGNLNYPALFQCLGMLVMLYAPAYWLAAREPERYGAFVVIGLAGKLLGIAGFLWAAASGELPWRFGYTLLTNDVIWLPAFLVFTMRTLQKGTRA